MVDGAMTVRGRAPGVQAKIPVSDRVRALRDRYRHLLPATRVAPDPALYWIFVTHVSVVRSLLLSLRFRGPFLVSRRTRIKIGRRSKVTFAPGSFLVVGFRMYTPTPAAIHLGRGATLAVEGTVQFNRGVRVFVHDGALLEMHGGAIVADHSTITCFEHITFEGEGGVSWYCNVMDTAAHEIIVDGVASPRSAPTVIGRRAMVGANSTVLAGVTIGAGSVVAAGSVVTKDVAPHSLVAGNPARVLSHDADWVL
jgi:acetyltransferase-like isoleucine patch superfamily enzyme